MENSWYFCGINSCLIPLCFLYCHYSMAILRWFQLWKVTKAFKVKIIWNGIRPSIMVGGTSFISRMLCARTEGIEMVLIPGWLSILSICSLVLSQTRRKKLKVLILKWVILCLNFLPAWLFLYIIRISSICNALQLLSGSICCLVLPRPWNTSLICCILCALEVLSTLSFTLLIKGMKAECLAFTSIHLHTFIWWELSSMSNVVSSQLVFMVCPESSQW